VILGKREHFTLDHYNSQRGTAPAELCELVVHCLELVALLGSEKLAFRFKGGNSLLLLLEDPQRFSIDVDIVTTESKAQLTDLVAGIVERSDVFQRWEARAPKTKPWLPLISFKLYFESRYQAPEDAFVMLDAVLEPPPYAGERKQVRCGSIYEANVDVEVPSVAGLIGDKLLTIGPSTLGIPLGKGKEAQRLKHVFDVSLLSRQPHDLEGVRLSLRGCREQEQAMQGRSFSWDDILLDTRNFCAEALRFPAPPPALSIEPGTYLAEIVTGFEGFRKHLFKLDYSWELFRGDCQRVIQLLDAVGTL
jgi:hypothetical protein